MNDDLFYLSKKGSVASHCDHVRHNAIFARADQILGRKCQTIHSFLLVAPY
jgi:hypothetical protein